MAWQMYFAKSLGWVFSLITCAGFSDSNAGQQNFLAKKHLELLPFEGKHLFGPSLKKYIKQNIGGKSIFLPQKKNAHASASRTSNPEARKGSFHPSQSSNFRSETETCFCKKTWPSKPAKTSAKASIQCLLKVEDFSQPHWPSGLRKLPRV